MSTSAHADTTVSAALWGCPTKPPQVQVADMARSLDFYLALGCEVRSAADGWALMSCARASFVLLHVTDPASGWAPPPPTDRHPLHPPVRLSTSDIRALRRRLLATGVPAAIVRPPHAPAGEMEIIDPDQHLVVIEQAGPESSGGPGARTRGHQTSRAHR
jgi:hypothetical protein